MDLVALVTAVIALITKGLEMRQQWWASLSPEMQNRLADKQAEGELRWLALLDPLVRLLDKLQQSQ